MSATLDRAHIKLAEQKSTSFLNEKMSPSWHLHYNFWFRRDVIPLSLRVPGAKILETFVSLMCLVSFFSIHVSSNRTCRRKASEEGTRLLLITSKHFENISIRWECPPGSVKRRASSLVDENNYLSSLPVGVAPDNLRKGRVAATTALLFSSLLWHFFLSFGTSCKSNASPTGSISASFKLLFQRSNQLKVSNRSMYFHISDL